MVENARVRDRRREEEVVVGWRKENRDAMILAVFPDFAGEVGGSIDVWMFEGGSKLKMEK